MLLIRVRRLQQLKRTLDIIAYGSTIIDAAIMLAVMLSLLGAIAGANIILAELNLVLAVVISLFVITGTAFVLTLNYDKLVKWWSVTNQRAVALMSRVRSRITKPRRYSYSYRLNLATRFAVKVAAAPSEKFKLIKSINPIKRLRSE